MFKENRLIFEQKDAGVGDIFGETPFVLPTTGEKGPKNPQESPSEKLLKDRKPSLEGEKRRLEEALSDIIPSLNSLAGGKQEIDFSENEVSANNPLQMGDSAFDRYQALMKKTNEGLKLDGYQMLKVVETAEGIIIEMLDDDGLIGVSDFDNKIQKVKGVVDEFEDFKESLIEQKADQN